MPACGRAGQTLEMDTRPHDDDTGGTFGEAEFQRSSQEFLRGVELIAELERQKRDLPRQDAQRLELADRIEGVAVDLLGRSQYQSRLVTTQANLPPGPKRPTHEILRDWRDAERRLHQAHDAVRAIVSESAGFQDEYRRTFEPR